LKIIEYTNYGAPDVLQLKEAEKPSPADHEVLVQVCATTVTVADIRSRSFTVPIAFWLPARISLGFLKPKKPVLGMELAGEVVGIGKNVKRFRVGDQVYAATLLSYGAYAEYICLAEDGPIALKPKNLTFGEAAAVPIGARTALHFLKKANIKSGQKILVYGASGSVGTYAVQLAKYFGAHVTGVCSTANLEMVKALGADRVIDYTKERFPVQGELYDIVFEAVNKSSFAACKKSLKPEGVYINITEPFPTPSMLWAQMTSGIKLILGQNVKETAEALEFLKELIEAGKMKPVIDRYYPFEKIVEAHRYVDTGRKKGNVVITVS